MRVARFTRQQKPDSDCDAKIKRRRPVRQGWISGGDLDGRMAQNGCARDTVMVCLASRYSHGRVRFAEQADAWHWFMKWNETRW
jgi:hypothetical protein